MFLIEKRNLRKARRTLGLSFACLLYAGLSPATAQTYDSYQGQDTSSGSQIFSSDPANTEIRIQQFESQISALTGKIEEQGNQIRQLQEQLEKVTGDLAMRVGDLEKSKTGGPATAITPAAPAENNASTDSGAAQSGSTGSGGYQWNSTREDSGSSSGKLGTLGQAGATDAAATQYESAFSALKAGDYTTAEAGFKDFIKNNPKHVLAGNAKYWLGETYYVRGDFQNASRTFAEAYQQYPKSSKAPDNLLKLGMSLASLNKKDDACVALGQIEKQYAAGAGPVLNRAKQEMKRLGC